jgi:outer membrane receptor for monomeric catechols
MIKRRDLLKGLAAGTAAASATTFAASTTAGASPIEIVNSILSHHVVGTLEVHERIAVYALDTVKLGETWQFIAGMRWDRFAADYQAARFSITGEVTGNESIARVDKEMSYRAALVYKPREFGTIYLRWGTSFNPSAEDLSFVSSGRGLSLSNSTLAPEENDTIELGTKGVGLATDS